MYNAGKKKRSVFLLRLIGVGLGVLMWGALTLIFTGSSWSKINADAERLSEMLTITESIVTETDANAAKILPETHESTNDRSGGVVMNREFVEVALVAEDHFMLENTKGVFYWIDIKYNENYAEGDLLCLIYKDKEKLEEDCWKVDPVHLYVNDNRVKIPQF